MAHGMGFVGASGVRNGVSSFEWAGSNGLVVMSFYDTQANLASNVVHAMVFFSWCIRNGVWAK